MKKPKDLKLKSRGRTIDVRCDKHKDIWIDGSIIYTPSEALRIAKKLTEFADWIKVDK